ncbi:MAG: hypothetical protein AAF533_24150 [Acidobacteriota bacterium]
MSRIKGAAINARLDFIRERHGQDTLDRIVDSLDDMSQVILTGTLLPSIWYPYQVLQGLDEAIVNELGVEADEVFEVAGEQVGRQHARSLFRVFHREADPERVLRLAVSIFSGCACGHGRLVLRKGQEPGQERLSVVGASAGRAHCLTLGAYFRTVLAYCTENEVEVREVRCRNEEGDSCEFEFAWQPVAYRRAAVGE